MTLRVATRASHRSLERSLAVLRPPLSQPRVVRFLEGLLACLRRWEPVLLSHSELGALYAGRSRLAALAHDIDALGGDPGRSVAAPSGWLDSLARSESAALGSFYVFEGATLGGEVIHRAVAKTPWAPLGGLASLRPYGDDAHRRWSEFQDGARLTRAARTPRVVEQGARDTFEALGIMLNDGAPA